MKIKEVAKFLIVKNPLGRVIAMSHRLFEERAAIKALVKQVDGTVIPKITGWRPEWEKLGESTNPADLQAAIEKHGEAEDAPEASGEGKGKGKK